MYENKNYSHEKLRTPEPLVNMVYQYFLYRMFLITKTISESENLSKSLRMSQSQQPTQNQNTFQSELKLKIFTLLNILLGLGSSFSERLSKSLEASRGALSLTGDQKFGRSMSLTPSTSLIMPSQPTFLSSSYGGSSGSSSSSSEEECRRVFFDCAL